jgi:hypothetical protein
MAGKSECESGTANRNEQAARAGVRVNSQTEFYSRPKNAAGQQRFLPVNSAT